MANNNTNETTLLVKLGDGAISANVPLVMKSRAARTRETNNNSRKKEAILLPLDFHRHYREVFQLKAALMDNNNSNNNITIIPPWNQKLDAVLWRGSATGPTGCFLSGKSKTYRSCDRLQLVRKYHNITQSESGSVSVDIGLLLANKGNHMGPDLSNKVEKYAKERFDMESMLHYKYLISVEGNDVATDLKWKLYSNSVVFMKPPTMVTWAMEDKLVPFYHYIPLAEDYSDLLEKVEWAHNHDEECQKIAYQSTKYMEALVTSDQAVMDEHLILKSMLTSYQNVLVIGYMMHVRNGSQNWSGAKHEKVT